MLNQGFAGYGAIMAKVEEPPGKPKGEWVSTFNSYSTEVSPDAETFQAQMELDYPGRHQNRTVLQGVVDRPALRGHAGPGRGAPLVQLPAHR